MHSDKTPKAMASLLSVRHSCSSHRLDCQETRKGAFDAILEAIIMAQGHPASSRLIQPTGSCL
jgi:hypothetical protein